MANVEKSRPPLPKRHRNPDLSIKMPQTNPSIVYRNTKYVPHISHNEFMQIYQNKASEFMFKQFEDLKDFTMDTAKTSLSVGEKFALWFYNKLKWLSKKWFTHLLLLVCLSAYSILGGILFTALEASSEQKYDKRLSQIRREAAITIHDISNNKTAFEDMITSIVAYLKDYENNYSDCMKHLNDNDTVKNTWTFWNSVFYAGTIFTTIGYGHIAPKTTYGRVATIVYAIIGIPLFLIVLADFGKLFTRIIKFFWAFIRRFYYTRSCKKVRRTVPMQEVIKGLNIVYDVVRRPSQIFSEEDIDELTEENKPPPVERRDSDVPPPLPPKPGTLRPDPEIATDLDTPAPSVFEIDDEFNLPISVAITILAIYIIIGALAFNLWEKWDFFESFYFVFISMSTIGLGDLVPDHPMFMMASILYLIFGLALTSMCINVVQVKLSDTFKQASAKLGATIGLKVAEEDGSLVPITPPLVEIAPVHKPKLETTITETKVNANNDIDSKNR